MVVYIICTLASCLLYPKPLPITLNIWIYCSWGLETDRGAEAFILTQDFTFSYIQINVFGPPNFGLALELFNRVSSPCSLMLIHTVYVLWIVDFLLEVAPKHVDSHAPLLIHHVVEPQRLLNKITTQNEISDSLKRWFWYKAGCNIRVKTLGNFESSPRSPRCGTTALMEHIITHDYISLKRWFYNYGDVLDICFFCSLLFSWRSKTEGEN